MRGLVFLAVLAATVSPAIAGTQSVTSAPVAQPVVPALGATMLDANARRLGYVMAVRPNGAVVISFRSGTITLPATTIRMVDGKLATSLSRAEVAKLD
jgi:hypothetical protein